MTLLKKIIILTIVTSLLIVCSYFYADKSIVYFFYSLGTRKYHWLYMVQQLPELLLMISALLLITAFILKNRNVQQRLRQFLFLVPVSIWIAAFVKSLLKYVCGRYWPETFENNNPSLLHDGMYGFHPFHAGVSYSSFPSGHAATIFAFATCIWIIYTRLRWVSVLVSLSVSLALLVLYYHFLSDLIAGAYIGILAGIFVNKLLRLPRTKYILSLLDDI
jgi:membrane-associated phospholipid phosphatase